MEQIDAHGAGADVGEPSLFCPHDGQEGEGQAEPDAVADQAADHTFQSGLAQCIVAVSSVEDLHRKSLVEGVKDQKCGKKQDAAG